MFQTWEWVFNSFSPIWPRTYVINIFILEKRQKKESIRSSPSQMLFKLSVFKKSCKIYRKTPEPVSFIEKLQVSPGTLSKKILRHRCSRVNSAKFLRTPFNRTPPDNCFWALKLIETLEWDVVKDCTVKYQGLSTWQ